MKIMKILDVYPDTTIIRCNIGHRIAGVTSYEEAILIHGNF